MANSNSLSRHLPRFNLNRQPPPSAAASIFHQSAVKSPKPTSNTIPLHFSLSRRHCSNHFLRFSPLSVARNFGQPEEEDQKEVVEDGLLALPAPSWIELYIPEFARPYAYIVRLDNQIGTWLFGWPSFLGVAMSTDLGSLVDLKMLGHFVLVAFMTRNLGCTINDIMDRDIDAMVERTKRRPLASGSMTPFQAFTFLGFLMLATYGLVYPLNDLSRSLWLSSLLLIFTYPFTKRPTQWAQGYMSVTSNFGVSYGWAACTGSLQPLNVLLPLFFSGFFWTLVFDTIYTNQDKEEDKELGLKSTAILFGDSTRNWITGFGIASIGGYALTGYNANLGWPYYACLAAAALQLAWQILEVDLSDPADCKRKFMSNKWFGAIIFSGIVLGKLFA